MKETDLSYLAGLIDGEGTFAWDWATSSRRLIIKMTHEETVRWLMTTFGGNFRAEPHQGYYAPCFTWSCGAKLLYELLPQTLPYMITKRAVASVILEAITVSRVYHRGGGKRNKTHLKVNAFPLYETFRALNKRTIVDWEAISTTVGPNWNDTKKVSV